MTLEALVSFSVQEHVGVIFVNENGEGPGVLSRKDHRATGG